MKSAIITGGIAFVLAAACGAAFAADNEAGVPLAPSDASGAWSVESAGHTLCVIELRTDKVGGGAFALQVPKTCQGALPGDVSGWTPTHDGMGLVGADGRTLIRFNRWSNSLFVSHASSGVDIQLRRGGSSAG